MSRVPNLEALVSAIVPASRNNEELRAELFLHCKDILNSHIGQTYGTDLTQITDTVNRRLLKNSPDGRTAQKFSNLISRLFDQPILSKKQDSILFLHSLSPTTDAYSSPAFLPNLVIPPTRKALNSKISPSPKQGHSTKERTKADILQDYLESKGNSFIPESLLLRDTLYLLQGISGKYIQFSFTDDFDNRIIFTEDTKYHISAPTKALLRKLSELGYLYCRIETFIREREGAAGIGMIEQSLCHHLHTQLTEYYRLIAVFETQMSNRRNDIQRKQETEDNSLAEEETGLSLRRLDVWVNEWRLRLRMMSVCVEGARGLKGGALVNLIHSYTDNGDPFVRKFTDKLLADVLKPFFATLRKWLFFGELNDPFSEFFVSTSTGIGSTPYLHPSSLTGNIHQPSTNIGFGLTAAENEENSRDAEGGLKLWEAKYQFRRDMLPMFLGEAFGKKIFSTGKSLNFIRYTCLDNDWVVTREKMSNNGDTLQYNDIAGLEKSIDTAYRIASHRLFEVFIEKFKLLDHLTALKSYLMLGNGDFSDQLMEALGPSLGRPANTLYRHNLTATLESAIRSSTAQHGSIEVLRRLDARMLAYSHGEIGWDVFTLEYKVDAPIDTVLDPESMEQYLKLFRHLWQMKRVEMALNRGWMRMTTSARTFLRAPDLEPIWHRIRLTLAEMLHFIRQMQAYCRLEVIECSWKILIDFMHKKEGDLDSLIGAHRSYLDRVVKKILLWNTKPGKEDSVLNQVRDIFSIILQFREATDDFYNYCLSESARRDQGLDSDRGVYTGPPQERQTTVLPELTKRLKDYGASFSEKTQSMVQHLQVHQDLDCRFLGIRLSFSDFYKTKK